MKERLTDGRQKTTMASCILLSYEIRILGKQSKSFGERVDCRPQNSITITIIQERKPQKLFNILNKQNNTISNPYAGIYYICGSGILFSTQIIVSCELDKENHIWLASLTNDITKNEAHYLIRKAKD